MTLEKTTLYSILSHSPSPLKCLYWANGCSTSNTHPRRREIVHGVGQKLQLLKFIQIHLSDLEFVIESLPQFSAVEGIVKWLGGDTVKGTTDSVETVTTNYFTRSKYALEMVLKSLATPAASLAHLPNVETISCEIIPCINHTCSTVHPICICPLLQPGKERVKWEDRFCNRTFFV